jgi:tetratricopeptide (TPR) repeat protein
MKRLSSTVLVLAFAVFGSLAAAQKKGAANTPQGAKKSTPTLQDLILQGKTADAVKLATKSPEQVAPLVKSTIEQADAQVADRKLSEAQTALRALDKFLESYPPASKEKEISPDRVRGRLFRIDGIQLNDQKQYVKAEEVLRKALELSKRADDKVLEAGIRNNLGIALQSQEKPNGEDRLEEAAKEFDMARELAEEQKDMVRAASCNFNLGRALQRLKRLDPALLAFRRAAEQSRSASRADIEARAVLYQGVVLSAINVASDEALKYFYQAEKMFETLGDKVNAGGSFRLAADHLAYQGKFPEAATLGERAAELFTSGGDKARLGNCYEFLADMYGRGKAAEDKAKAEKYKKLAAELGKPDGK